MGGMDLGTMDMSDLKLHLPPLKKGVSVKFVLVLAGRKEDRKSQKSQERKIGRNDRDRVPIQCEI